MVGAVIQARMGSTRLPGKVLAELADSPLLWHVFERLKTCQRLDKIIVATTRNPEDDALEEFCHYHNILVYRGSSDDVLDRYLSAALAFDLDTVVRVCSDSPLIDPFAVDELIRLQTENQADVVTISPDKTSLLDGFEVVTTATLKWMSEQDLAPYHREHVTVYAKEHPEQIKIMYYNPPKELCVTDIRITVDTEADLAFMREVYNWLYDKDKLIDVRRLDKLPFSLFRLNAGIQQKPADKSTLSLQIITPQIDDKLQEIKKILENSSYIKVDFFQNKPLKISDANTITFQRLD